MSDTDVKITITVALFAVLFAGSLIWAIDHESNRRVEEALRLQRIELRIDSLEVES